MNGNDKYVNFQDPVDLAKYIVQLEKEGAAYIVIDETNGSHSVRVTGY